MHSVDIIEHRTQQARACLPRHIPARYRDIAVTNAAVSAWVAEVVAGGTDSILLAGPVGSGKTHQAYAALAAVTLGKAARGQACQPAAITHGDLTAATRPDGEGIDRVMTAGVLLLDDLGAAHTTSWNADAVYRVIDHRWAEMLPTIVTSNFDPGTLSAQLSERLTSRLFGMCQTVELDGRDRRMQ